MRAAAPSEPTSPRLRLQRMARWMRWLIAIGALGLVFAMGYVWFGDTGVIERRIQQLAGAPITSAGVKLPSGVRLGLILISAIGMAVGLFILAQAWALFGAYGRGQVFGPGAIQPIRRIAWALVGAAMLRPLSETLSVLLLTWHNPPGQRHLVLSASWEDYLCLLFGGLLSAMAWAMTEASRLEQDNAGFV